jgi:hypothetical protein
MTPARPNAADKAHYERAARIDTRDLAQRVRRMAAEQRATRTALEADLRAQHWGRMPEGWHGS